MNNIEKIKQCIDRQRDKETRIDEFVIDTYSKLLMRIIYMGALEQLRKEVVSDQRQKNQYELETQIYNIAIVLKNIRKKKELTQKDIAQRTGLTQQMISKIESYNGNPSIESFVKYCNGIGINLLEVLSKYDY